MSDLAVRLSDWIPQVQGRYVNEDWNAENDGFGAQCWDLAANWSKHLGLPVINTGGAGRWPGWAGNMVDAFPQSPAIAAAYELLPPTAAAQAGDIAVWGDSYWYYPKTHVAVVVRDGGLLTCISQNSTPSRVGNPYPAWTTGPATIQTLPKQGLIGYIRPRTGISAQGTITTTEEDDMLTDAQIEAIAAKVFAYKFDRQGGRPGVTDLGAIVANFDAIVGGLIAEAVLSREIVSQLAVQQGAVIDYDLIAKKVADEQAKRLAK